MAGIYDFADAYTNADRLGKIFIRTGHGGSPEDQPDDLCDLQHAGPRRAISRPRSS